jgi:hypothetical protein
MSDVIPGQLLHLVFGGELTSPESVDFKDLSKLDIVGIYPNYKQAYDVWKSKAQASVDNAAMRYFVVHIHKLMAPE